MRVVCSATLGFALALGAAGAHAQSVTTRQIDNEPVETTVTQTPNGTVITRRPLAAAPAASTVVDETVGVAPTTRTRHVVHHARRTTTEHTVTRTVRTTRRVAVAPPLVLAPAQRQVIYRTLVQEQVVPQVAPQVVPSVPGYPPFPPPAARTVVVAPSETTGYAVSTPAEVVDDDGYAEEAPAVYAAPYTVGSVLPASVAVTPLPARATVAVPAVRPYRYATMNGRVLLVDPVTNTVVADVTP
jgi:hypothetical protein